MRMPRADEAGSRRNFDLLVFDWDGTLSDSTTLIADSIQAACRDLGQSPPGEDAARYVIGLGFASAVRHVAPGLAPAAYPAFSAAYRRHYLAGEPAVPLFDGVREMLAALELAGYLIAVATGKSRAGLDHAMARSGMAGVFHATRCADEGQPKPHPDMLLNLMAFLTAEPGRTLMIGDTSHDLELARNAGARALAVGYGAHSAADLAAHAPLSIVGSIAALRAWLAVHG
jgi:phosphoglycolate phosphatase